MAGVEAAGFFHGGWIHALGVTLVAARVAHAYAFFSIEPPGVLAARAGGTLGTLFVIAVGAFLNVIQFLLTH